MNELEKIIAGNLSPAEMFARERENCMTNRGFVLGLVPLVSR